MVFELTPDPSLLSRDLTGVGRGHDIPYDLSINDFDLLLKSFTGKLVSLLMATIKTHSRSNTGTSKPSASSTYTIFFASSTRVTNPPPTAFKKRTLSPFFIIILILKPV